MCFCFSAVPAVGVPVAGVLDRLQIFAFAFQLEKIVQLMNGYGEC